MKIACEWPDFCTKNTCVLNHLIYQRLYMYSLAFDQSYMISPSTVESDVPEDRRSHSHNR
jgi:hypothetical protein